MSKLSKETGRGKQLTSRTGIAILGATGSIGRQALDVIQAFDERFRVVALEANRSFEAMAELVLIHKPQVVAMADPQAAKELGQKLAGKASLRIESGPESFSSLASAPEVDVVLAAVAGSAGLASVHAAVQAGKKVALANKESLVMAGELLMAEAAQKGATILPVDSEHAGVHQLVTSVGKQQVRRIVLTASGGPFLGRTHEELKQVTAKEALAHPNWNMGDKISIDSATMMNKGFEIMEARWLFDLPEDHIEVVIHPESVVHALVETIDGAMLAHLAQPDMRLPIAYALGYPDQLDLPARIGQFKHLDLAEIGKLSFQTADPERFPALTLCRRALQAGSGMPAALSMADDVLVEAFLQERIRFTQVTDILETVLQRLDPRRITKLSDVMAAGLEGARLARELSDAP
jgi:1-deoxy-D-xylulose-5-phosphate reductoisomerase